MQVFKSFLSTFDDKDIKDKINDEDDNDNNNNVKDIDNSSTKFDSLDTTKVSNVNKKKKKKGKKLSEVPSTVSNISSNPTFDADFDEDPFIDTNNNINVNNDNTKKINIQDKKDIKFEPATNFDDFEFVADDSKADIKIDSIDISKSEIIINNHLNIVDDSEDPFGNSPLFDVPSKISSVPVKSVNPNLEDPFAESDLNNNAENVTINENDPFSESDPIKKIENLAIVENDPFAESDLNNINHGNMDEPFDSSMSQLAQNSLAISEFTKNTSMSNDELQIEDPFGDSKGFESPDAKINKNIKDSDLEDPFGQSSTFDLPSNTTHSNNFVEDPFGESPSFFLPSVANDVNKNDKSSSNDAKTDEDPFESDNTFEQPAIPSISKLDSDDPFCESNTLADEKVEVQFDFNTTEESSKESGLKNVHLIVDFNFILGT